MEIYSSIVGSIALIISIAAYIHSVKVDKKNLKNYQESILPILSCSFSLEDEFFYFDIRNVGKTEAKEVKIKNVKLQYLKKDSGNINEKDIVLFHSDFNLFPKENVKRKVDNYRNNFDDSTLKVEYSLSFVIEYNEGNRVVKKIEKLPLSVL